MQLADTNDLALWYALNRLMTNYWADVAGNSGSQAHEFYCRTPFPPSARTGSRGRSRSGPFMIGAGSAAVPPRVT